MNPYASFLNGRDALDVLRTTPSELQSLIAGLTPEAMDTPPAPGKWSVREILAHLADCEIVWAFRIRQILETPGGMVTPFDQDIWAKHYRAYSAAQALSVFLALRTWNIALLTTVSAEVQSNLVTHPERGTFPFREMIESIAGHDLNHLTRLHVQLAG
jgi:uncharacterized damage-inducible protein DinB